METTATLVDKISGAGIYASAANWAVSADNADTLGGQPPEYYCASAEVADEFADMQADIDYISGAIDDIPAQVQSDWTEDDTTSPAFIQHKPAELSMSAGEGIGITESNDTLIFSVTGDYADAADFANLADDMDILAAASADWDAKQDELVFGYDENDAISSINLSSIACQTLVAGQNVTIVDDIIDIKNNECSADATSIAFGNKSQASGEYSLCYGSANEGKSNIASGKCCINLGWGSSAIGNCSVIIGGYRCLASSDNDKYGPVAQGLQTSAFGYYSHAEGQYTIAAGDYTHTEGASTYAESASHAEGQLTSAYGQNSHTEGLYNFTSANYSHTEGVYTQTLGQGSHAEGLSSVAKGNCSHAEGHATSAFGSRSHSEGHETLASGNRSHSEGSGTIAVGSASHVEGMATSAIGNYSHAEGNSAWAAGHYSHAEGMYTIASGEAQHVQGKYNVPNTTDLFQIGNGTGDNERSNAFIVTNAGLASAKNLGTSGYPDIDNTLTTMNQMIASFGGFKVVPGTGTDLHPDVASADTKTIYLTQDTNVTGNDQYKEWIWKAADPEATPSVGSAWNLIGDTSIDLNGYAQMPVSHTASNIAVYGQGDTLVDNNVPLTSVQNVQPDWEQTDTNAYDYIQNKPEQMTLTGGSYIDITTASNQLTIDANIANISGAMTGYANVQADWNETNSASDAYIANKPDILIPQIGAGVSATPKYIMVVTAMPAAAAIDPNTIYLVKENVS